LGLVELDDDAWPQQTPWYGWLSATDSLADLLVHEAGLHESHVNYNKGCFVGQEVVARTQHRGKPNKGVFLVQPLDDPILTPDEELTDSAGKAQGRILSTCDLPSGDRGYVALLKLKAATEGGPLFAREGDVALQQLILTPEDGTSS